MIEGWSNVDRLAVIDCESKGSRNGRQLVVLRYTGTFNGNKYEWKYSASIQNDATLGRTIQSGIQCINAISNNGIAKASPLSFDRFVKGKVKPFVAITRLVGSKDTLLGYKLVDCHGNVRNARISDMIDTARQYEANGNGCLVQNLVFIKDGQNKRAYFKEMSESIPVEKVIADVAKKHAVTNNVVNKSAEQIMKEVETEPKKPEDVKTKDVASKKFTREQAKVLFEGERKGIDVSMIKNPDINAACMRAYLLDMENGLDISYYLDPKFNLGQLMEISTAFEEGLDITPMVDPSISQEEMCEMRVRMEDEIFVDYKKLFNVESK